MDIEISGACRAAAWRDLNAMMDSIGIVIAGYYSIATSSYCHHQSFIKLNLEWLLSLQYHDLGGRFL